MANKRLKMDKIQEIQRLKKLGPSGMMAIILCLSFLRVDDGHYTLPFFLKSPHEFLSSRSLNVTRQPVQKKGASGWGFFGL